MNQNFGLRNRVIDIRKMGKGWTLVNWLFLFFGTALMILNVVGSWAFNIPDRYILYAGFAFMFAFIGYVLIVLIVFSWSKNVEIWDNGMTVVEDYQRNPLGQAVIDEQKHETIFVKPPLRQQYGVLYLGLAIWLGFRAFALFEVLFLDNRHPMTVGEYILPVFALILCGGVTIIIAGVGVRLLVRPFRKTEKIQQSTK